jgi:putative PIN family toxin of toxin-antitoxin system
MIKAVLDTNIIISAIFWSGSPYRVLRSGFTGKYQMILSFDIIKELVERLRHKFKLPEKRIDELLNLLLFFCHFVEPSFRLKIVKEDPSDDKIIECALAGEAKYIVTGDPHLLKLQQVQHTKIITAAEFLDLIK